MSAGMKTSPLSPFLDLELRYQFNNSMDTLLREISLLEAIARSISLYFTPEGYLPSAPEHLVKEAALQEAGAILRRLQEWRKENNRTDSTIPLKEKTE